jgi:hypothetical protein
MKNTDASSLTNAQLTAEVTRLARGEREATVALIIHLAEFGERSLHIEAGFSSLFDYCMEVLHLSEDAAFNRVQAARAARRFPVIIDMLLKGSLSPTTARMLSRKLTSENHQELLSAASGKPQPAPIPRPVVRPLAPQRYEIRFTASEGMHEKLELARDMASHAIPSGDLAQVFERALDVYLEHLARQKFSATKRPRKSRGQAEDSRNMPRRPGARSRYRARDDRRPWMGRRAVHDHRATPPFRNGNNRRGRPLVPGAALGSSAAAREASRGAMGFQGGRERPSR